MLFLFSMSSLYKRFILPLKAMRALKHPPHDGYTVYTFDLSNQVQEYLAENSQKLSIVIISRHDSELHKKFQAEIAKVPLGHPDHVTMGYIDAKNCTDAFLDANRVVSLPTSLLFYDRKLVYKTCGLRPSDLSIKARLALRAAGLNPCSINLSDE